DRSVELVEPRRCRASFLQRCAEELGLTNVTVVAQPVEKTSGIMDVITARAAATRDQLFTWTNPRRHRGTVYILPKGASAVTEIEQVRASWQGLFHVEQSVTDPTSSIVIASEVQPCTVSR